MAEEQGFSDEEREQENKVRRDAEKTELLRNLRKQARKEGTVEEKMQALLNQAEIFTKFLINKHHGKRRGNRRDFQGDESELSEDEDDDNIFEQPKILVGGQLKNYQLMALNWMKTLYQSGLNGILADDMGLGKTIQTIALLGYLRQFKKVNGPHLIIAPKITLSNWQNEFRKWLPGTRVVKLIATKEEREEILNEEIGRGKFDVVITSYEGVRLGQRELKRINWCYLIIDEAHKIRNEESVLSQTVRSLRTRHKLLLTGTPLQNNLHELWSLLNFILPQLFDSSEIFDNWFAQKEGEPEQNQARNIQMVQKLHRILRPFMLRRTKSEVEKALPPKKQIHLYVGLTEMQLKLYKSLLHNRSSGGADDKKFYLNLLMQLRKACNHPYLFPGCESPDLPVLGQHLIQASGKMIVLDKLLNRLKTGGHKVLLFSQMTLVLDILEDYCTYREFDFCRIDGSTDMDVRDNNIAEFMREDSSKFIFLLSTRAGGLGINLTAADTVIIYDSDWNPQMDLQAMDRAHRIGQKSMVNVYRMITENTVEEKIIERQTVKLKWDSLVIQQGRMSNSQKNRLLSKEEMKDMLQFGASVIFKASQGTMTNQDIDQLLVRGQGKTQMLNSHIQSQLKLKENMLDLRITSISIYDMAPDRRKEDMEALDKQMAIALYEEEPRSRRQKKHVPDPQKKEKKNRKSLVPEYQFFQNRNRLQELLYQIQDLANGEPDVQPLTQQEVEEKERLERTGFRDWSRNDFTAFVNGCQKFGKDNLQQIAAMVGKSLSDVQAYSEAFWKDLDGLSERDKILKQIMGGEQKLKLRHEHQILLNWKLDTSPLVDFNPQIYLKFKSKLYSAEADRFLITKLQRYGVSSMAKVMEDLYAQSIFRFDHYLRSRTEGELNKRMQSLYKLIEKEKEYVELGPKAKQILKKRKKEEVPVQNTNKVIEINSEESVEMIEPAPRKVARCS